MVKKLRYKQVYTLPFPKKIPNSNEDWLAKTPTIRLFFKYLKRRLLLKLRRQMPYLCDELPEKTRRVLWVNLAAPSLGDTLMDLSSRVLLKERGIEVDLFANSSYAMLYSNDQLFDRVITLESDVMAARYDAVIVDCFGGRSMGVKCRVAAKLPFVSTFGLYNAGNLNRVLFSYYRMNVLLGSPWDSQALYERAKPYLTPTTHALEKVKNLGLPKHFIAFALGGRWAHRTYQHWPVVIRELLVSFPKLKIVLTGSDNGLAMRDEVLATAGDAKNRVIDVVNQLSFLGSAELIQQAELFVCADGGLFHAANSVATTSVCLLAGIKADFYQTGQIRGRFLYDNEDVNRITVANVVHAVAGYLNQ